MTSILTSSIWQPILFPRPGGDRPFRPPTVGWDRRGSLVAVVGSVGSGKSALLGALLGDLHKRAGQVTVRGSMALVAQQAWIQNASLRDNILYGYPYDPARYRQCLLCASIPPTILHACPARLLSSLPPSLCGSHQRG